MLNEKQIQATLQKLTRLENILSEKIFTKVDIMPAKWYKTTERLHKVPEDALFAAYEENTGWGEEGQYCWFKGAYTVPENLAGKRLFIYPKTGGYETMLWVNGVPSGIFAAKFVVGSHGNHYCDMLVNNAEAGQKLDVALECYSGHYCAGAGPLTDEFSLDYNYKAGPIDICVKDEFIQDFVFDLKIVLQMAKVLDSKSFRHADVINALVKVHSIVYYSQEDAGEEIFINSLKEAQPYLKEILASKNSASAPYAGLIGHSHMDTAWLWTIDETIKKCARTYSNQLNLMEQYPEYMFVQSSAYHSEVIRRNYPQLFEKIKAAVASGRYEPNGGVWIECDCNIVSGESLVRQFLWGQKYTQKHFGYTADSFWLPDTFGYSAAIPQIMQQSGVKYFLTTKIAWNDTNDFPYDTFWWKGIDGTKVLTHFNKTHIWPDADALDSYVVSGRENGNCIKEKTVSDMRLLSFGFGDGGGGPQFEMLETARRLNDVEGLPRSSYTTVSNFMQELEKNIQNPSTHNGELYLELHRGTLTNKHQIKRNNRLAETALHNLEFFTVKNAVESGIPASSENINPLVETLLVNQFHDILPGTSITPVHEQSIKETTALIENANKATVEIAQKNNEADFTTLCNVTSFERADVAYIDFEDGKTVAGGKTQVTDLLNGGKKLAVSGINVPAYSGVSLEWQSGAYANESAFKLKGNKLSTPFAEIEFDDNGFISSFIDKTANRQLCGDGYALNTFLVAEDVPSYWDNWDIDADVELKFKPVAKLESRNVISDGGVELRIRSKYKLTEKTSITQDMVFYAESPLVRFDTVIDWQDNHKLLKTAFDTAVETADARFEIQFGNLKRPTSRNNNIEKAMFEVCNHKYTDLSETRYGVSLLNDCKYGLSVNEGQMRLTLHKGGNRPDVKGDMGSHFCTYAFLPHNSGFSVPEVVKPAYLLNNPVIQLAGNNGFNSLLNVSADNIIIETVKPLEDGGNGFVVRLYEAEGTLTNSTVTVNKAKSITAANMLEEAIAEPIIGNEAKLCFKPFEIKTLVIA